MSRHAQILGFKAHMYIKLTKFSSEKTQLSYGRKKHKERRIIEDLNSYMLYIITQGQLWRTSFSDSYKCIKLSRKGGGGRYLGCLRNIWCSVLNTLSKSKIRNFLHLQARRRVFPLLSSGIKHSNAVSVGFTDKMIKHCSSRKILNGNV